MKSLLKRILFGEEAFGRNYHDFRNHTTTRQKLDVIRYNRQVNRSGSPYPLYAKIEINGQCNLDCVMCRRTQLPYRNVQMTLDDFNRILDELSHIVTWSPHGYNEPLLHPQFFDFVKAANDRHIRLFLVTNGTLLDPDTTDELMDLSPYKISVSIDAIGKEYENIRRGSSWSLVKQNIEYLARVTANSDTKFSLYATVWVDNIDQVPALIEFAQSINVPISFADITWTNEYRESRNENALRENDELSHTISLIERTASIGTHYSLTKKNKRTCTLPWSAVYIDVMGFVYPCTDNLDKPMGNILETPFDNIWKSENYRVFREGSYDGLWERCKNCLAWGESP